MKSTSLIVFDLDGTLWDSSENVVISWNETLRQAGVDRRITLAEMRRYMGRPTSDIFDDFFADMDVTRRRALQQASCDQQNEYLRKHGGVVSPSLIRVLESLSKRYTLAIVSNCHKGYIETFLEHYDLGRYFADTACFGDTGLGKADNIRAVVAKSGCDRALYVGDTASDAEAAKAADILFVHAAYGYGQVEKGTPAIGALSELPSKAASLLAAVPFYPANVLLPQSDFDKWAVIACDQFTSEPHYWEEIDRLVGDTPSALRLIFPEVYLSDEPEKRIDAINRNMAAYLDSDLLTEYPDALIYVERTLPDGSVRKGLVGMIDLEAYGIEPHTEAPIRATEGMIPSRIPPRVAIRRDAPMELPHVMLLIDDNRHTVMEPLATEKLPLIYDVDLIGGGGHIRGYLVPAERQSSLIDALGALAHGEHPMLFAVGDGNHSLVTAKTCYEQSPTEKNRYSLVEVVNIHDESLDFEPIYRVLFNVDVQAVLADMQAAFDKENGAETPQTIHWVAGEKSGVLTVSHPTLHLTIGTLQAFLNDYLPKHPEIEVDYIHGEETVKTLSQRENTLGLLYDGIAKSDLFPAIAQDGVLPRKTFSMGEAQSKRYYMEARKIK